MTVWTNTLTAVLSRIEATGETPHEYDVITIVDTIDASSSGIAEFSDLDFLRLLTRNVIEYKTELPCPAWCTDDAKHPFESTNALTGRQSRPHELRIGPDVGAAWLALVQEDERDKDDDSTGLTGRPEVSFEVDGSFQADELRKLAGALLNAADILDEVNR